MFVFVNGSMMALWYPTQLRNLFSNMSQSLKMFNAMLMGGKAAAANLLPHVRVGNFDDITGCLLEFGIFLGNLAGGAWEMHDTTNIIGVRTRNRLSHRRMFRRLPLPTTALESFCLFHVQEWWMFGPRLVFALLVFHRLRGASEACFGGRLRPWSSWPELMDIKLSWRWREWSDLTQVFKLLLRDCWVCFLLIKLRFSQWSARRCSCFCSWSCAETMRTGIQEHLGSQTHFGSAMPYGFSSTKGMERKT